MCWTAGSTVLNAKVHAHSAVIVQYIADRFNAEQHIDGGPSAVKILCRLYRGKFDDPAQSRRRVPHAWNSVWFAAEHCWKLLDVMHDPGTLHLAGSPVRALYLIPVPAWTAEADSATKSVLSRPDNTTAVVAKHNEVEQQPPRSKQPHRVHRSMRRWSGSAQILRDGRARRPPLALFRSTTSAQRAPQSQRGAVVAGATEHADIGCHIV